MGPEAEILAGPERTRGLRGRSLGRLALTALLLPLACGTAKEEHDVQPARVRIPARLTLEFERSRYAAGEPIVGLARLQNLSPDSISGIPPIDIGGERLHLAIKDLDHSTRVDRVGYFSTIVYPGPGLTLGPGDSYVEVLDLSNHYGAVPDSGQPLNALGKWVLPRGRYEVRASIVPATDATGPRRAPLVSDPVMFEILAGSLDASQDRVWRELMSVPWKRNTLSPENQRVCKQLLGEAANSPWFWLIYEASGRMAENEFEDVLQSARRDSAPGIRSAILLARRYATPLKNEAQYLHLIDARYSETRSDAERWVLSTLRMKASQYERTH